MANLRRAGVEDAASLVRLRAAMLTAISSDLSSLRRLRSPEAGVPRVDLRATTDGRRLSAGAGFRELGGGALSWTSPS